MWSLISWCTTLLIIVCNTTDDGGVVCILHKRVLGVMSVQCEQYLDEHTALLGGRSFDCQSKIFGVCLWGSLMSSCSVPPKPIVFSSQLHGRDCIGCCAEINKEHSNNVVTILSGVWRPQESGGQWIRHPLSICWFWKHTGKGPSLQWYWLWCTEEQACIHYD